MMRRLLLGITATTLFAAPTQSSIADLWNSFAATTREWVMVQEEVDRTPGLSPVQAQRLWAEKVRPAFRAVDLAVRNQ